MQKLEQRITIKAGKRGGNARSVQIPSAVADDRQLMAYSVEKLSLRTSFRGVLKMR